MSTIGRRGSRDTGWNWPLPPGGPGRPPPPPLLPLAGAALLFAAIAAALLAVWLSDSDGAAPPPTATPAATHTPAATATATATPAPSPAPSPTPSPTPEPDFSFEVWGGKTWQASPPVAPGAFREGQAIPLMLRVEGARPGDSYGLTLRYTCRSLQFLSAYDRDGGSAPALAPGGPRTAVPDSIGQLPDDPTTAADDGEDGRLSLWGGTFGPVELTGVSGPCAFERRLNVSLMAGGDTLYLLWGAVVAPGAADAGLPLRVTVFTERGERRIEIDPAAIAPGP